MRSQLLALSGLGPVPVLMKEFQLILNSDFIGATVIQFEMFDQTDIFSWTSTDT
jgi:hypothetical protein